MKAVLVTVLALLGTCLGAVTSPKTPNQILDKVLEGALDNIRDMTWDVSKKVANGYSTFPLNIETEIYRSSVDTSEQMSVSKAHITGLGNIRRSKSASFNADKTLLSGSLVIENVTISASFDLVFEGDSHVPSSEAIGQVSQTVDKVFADVEMRLDNLVPQNIQSYSAHAGHVEPIDASNINPDMQLVDEAGMRKALVDTIVKTVNTNIKVMVNKSIQAWKNSVAQ